MFPDNYLESINYHLKLSNYFAVINTLDILAVTAPWYPLAGITMCFVPNNKCRYKASNNGRAIHQYTCGYPTCLLLHFNNLHGMLTLIECQHLYGMSTPLFQARRSID